MVFVSVIKMHPINSSWKPLFDKYRFDLDIMYYTTADTKHPMYPPKDLVFRVFEMDVREIRLLLLGQDPYHSPNQANGLSFSVNSGIAIPPSLKNIFKQIQDEFPDRKYTYDSGNLERWFVEEKIFLLNASLTVIKNKAGSHIKMWKQFTDDVIQFISANNTMCIFVLLGNFAKSKAKYILNQDNVITGTHPSPLSAYNGFFGSQIFTRIEEKLGQRINWNI